MGLAKSIKVILGIVATSSAALVLSGSAFASSTGTSTTSETLSATTSHEVEATTVTPSSVSGQAEADIKPEVPNTAKLTTEAIGESSVPQTVLSGAVASNGGTVKAGEAVLSPTTTKPVVGSDVVVGAAGLVTAVKADSIVAGRVDNTSVAPHDSGMSRPQVVPAPLNSPASQSSQVTAVAPDVVFGSAVLPVQPKITNSRPLSGGDLAALVPSAPAQQQNPASVPTPSQPTGLLTRLTSELAGVVVPHTFASQSVAAVHVTAQLMIILASILLLVGLTSVTFGARLRRSGYVHAARSDVADSLTSLFATPVRLSYVSALQPSHSSFLMVSETKILS